MTDVISQVQMDPFIEIAMLSDNCGAVLNELVSTAQCKYAMCQAAASLTNNIKQHLTFDKYIDTTIIFSCILHLLITSNRNKINFSTTSKGGHVTSIDKFELSEITFES